MDDVLQRAIEDDLPLGGNDDYKSSSTSTPCPPTGGGYPLAMQRYARDPPLSLSLLPCMAPQHIKEKDS